MDFYIQQIKNIYHLAQAIAACVMYGFPGKKITIIGVTGTDGKTTTSSLIAHILKSSGKRVSSITTVSASVGEKRFDTGFHTTTPSPFAVQRFLRDAVRHGDEFFVLETTSHALDQYRVWGVPFAYGVITNITHEHLHYHKTFENYVSAKAKILKWSKIGILNRDDQSCERILQHASPKRKMVTFGSTEEVDYSIEEIRKNLGSLPRFNLYNYAASYAVCDLIGIPATQIFDAMRRYHLPPGRLEVVYSGNFTVIVDFAHTPNSLQEALESLRPTYPKGRIIHIFGAAAFRDDTKRPLMGRASGTFSDIVILSEEDYRTEDPQKICHEIARGLEEKDFSPFQYELGKNPSSGKKYTTIIDRKKAIEYALSIARTHDVIVLTGKGHEQSLCRGKIEHPWNDAQAVRDLLSK